MSVVCFFNTTKAWGGGEKWHLEVSAHLHQKGYEVLLFAHSDGVLFQRAQEKGVPSIGIRASNLSFLNPIKIYRLKQRFLKNRIRVIVMNLSRDVKMAGLAAKWAKVPRIIYRRGSDIPVRNTVLNRYLFRSVVSEVLTNSEATSASVLANNPELIPESQITKIYNGLYINDINKKFAIDTTALHPIVKLVTLGRLEAQKNPLFLVEVARALRARKCRFELHIGGEGRLRNDLEQAIAEHDLDDIITLHGFIQEPYSFLAGGDIFVLPSLWEGFGYVLVEAASLGLPIVAFDSSSNPEVVPQNQAGFLTQVNDVEAFADAVETLIREPDLRMRFGKFGKEYVRQHFDLDKNLLEIESYLNREPS